MGARLVHICSKVGKLGMWIVIPRKLFCVSVMEINHYLKIRIRKEVWKGGNRKKDLQGKFEIAIGLSRRTYY